MRDYEIYMSKENRDYRAKALKAEGFRARKSSDRGVLLHPMYIRDYELETGKRLTQADKGFGSAISKTFFAAIYFVYYTDSPNPLDLY